MVLDRGRSLRGWLGCGGIRSLWVGESEKWGEGVSLMGRNEVDR